MAATYPLELVKADRVVQHNSELAPEELKAEIEAQEFDPSVEVLAIAFPTVLAGMSEHVEWTEIMGNAMLAQSDDVMDAVQVMRNQAINSGSLVDTPEQTVTVVETVVDETDDEDLDATLSTQSAPAETVVIEPANTSQVYVPTYDPNAVYGSGYSSPYYAGSGFRWQDAALGTAVAYGTVSLIDEIFNDDDDWNDYWGCRNCGGWNGDPIVRDPEVNIDVDGNVNVGNRVHIDKDGKGKRKNKNDKNEEQGRE